MAKPKRAQKRSKLEKVTGWVVDPASLAASRIARDSAIAALRVGTTLDAPTRTRIIFWLEVLNWLEKELSRTGGRRPNHGDLMQATIAKALVDEEGASLDQALACAIGATSVRELDRIRSAYHRIERGRAEPVDPPDAQMQAARNEFARIGKNK